MSPWRVTAAVATLLMAASCAATREPEDDAGDAKGTAPSTSSSLASTPVPQDPVLSPGPGEVLELDQHGPEYVFTKEGRYAVRLAPRWVYEVDAPDMWEVYRGRYFSTSDFSGGSGVFSVYGPVTEAWLPAHPCRDRSRVPVGGPTARDLADAVAALPVLAVTKPEPVRLAGGRGLSFDVSIPSRFDPSVCERGEVAVFNPTRREDDWWDLPAGETYTYWILDVDGQRWVINGWCETSCTDEDFETLAGMAESVTFEHED